jgi:hypothetical protein
MLDILGFRAQMAMSYPHEASVVIKAPLTMANFSRSLFY